MQAGADNRIPSLTLEMQPPWRQRRMTESLLPEGKLHPHRLLDPVKRQGTTRLLKYPDSEQP